MCFKLFLFWVNFSTCACKNQKARLVCWDWPPRVWKLDDMPLPERIVLQAWNLASRLNSQNQDQVKYHGWSATIPRMVTHHPKDGHPPSKIKIYQTEVYYRLGIWHLDLIHKIKTQWQLPWMVSHYPHDGHPPPPSHGWSLTIQNLPDGIVLQTWNLVSRID